MGDHQPGDHFEHSMSEREAAAGAVDADGKGPLDLASPARDHANGRERDDEAEEHHDNGNANANGRSFRSPKKRRKVAHACLYCRRSHMTCDLERPCTRCIKRNIGHLCHDQPREADTRRLGKALASRNAEVADEADDMPSSDAGSNAVHAPPAAPPAGFDDTIQRSSSGFGAGDMLRQDDPLGLVQPDASSSLELGTWSNTGNANQFAGFSDAWLTAQNFQDMSIYNPNYMIGPEVTHEFNLINDFLHNSLLDDSHSSLGDPQNRRFARAGATSSSDMMQSFADGRGMQAGRMVPAGQFPGALMPPPASSSGEGKMSSKISEKDKTREYYLQAADPSGNDNPEERMSRVLRAKYEAGLLKPFNYINGYARLGKYLDGHIAPSSKQKILRTINQFRPKFREKAQGLTDMQLVYVEMWFEKQLMDYDRVFASMAVPACCWRRTGEIFRGNKEMAELIHVPVDQLRDGKIALHEILTEESMVRYWEEFGTIAFDPAHDTLLTACSLKNPSDSSDHPIVKSCFSFTIRRDDHKLPALIVGNFLPHDPPPH